jgi:RHS repeat-associated protein
MAITADSGGTPCPPCRGAVPPQGGRGVAELRYKAWGENRYTYGSTPTTYKFTGQRLDDSTGLYFYQSRYYDPALGRFIAPDTIVPEPGNPQALNRYAYVTNNPLKYTDPSGHWLETAWDILNIAWDIQEIRQDPGNL